MRNLEEDKLMLEDILEDTERNCSTLRVDLRLAQARLKKLSLDMDRAKEDGSDGPREEEGSEASWLETVRRIGRGKNFLTGLGRVLRGAPNTWSNLTKSIAAELALGTELEAGQTQRNETLAEVSSNRAEAADVHEEVESLRQEIQLR